MTKSNAISAAKANRLYWLGRYTERVYISLHLLRRYYDKMIDSEGKEYEEFYQKLDGSNPYPDTESFRLGYMYDDKNPCSIISGLTAANDNAIVLREEIMSETLSYIQLSLCHIQQMAKEKDANITNLQCITDYLLAFWGSADERISNPRVSNIMHIGKGVENIDMHIRFDYPFYRIEEAYTSLVSCLKREYGLADRVILSQLDQLLTQNQYESQTPEYKAKVLKYINHLVLV